MPLTYVRRTALRYAARIPIGARLTCNICGARIRKFLPYRNGVKDIPPLIRQLDVIGSDVEHYECPACGCHDRERHLLMYLLSAGLLSQIGGARLLHIAPEQHLQHIIFALQPLEYVRGDLNPEKPGTEKIDLQSVPYPTDHFDFILVNHVLEHVDDDLQALSEIWRILRPGGHAILQTPYSPVLTRTFEDPGIVTDDGCLHAYGQEDHRRLYGRDIEKRFSSVGLYSKMSTHAELLPDINSVAHGVNVREPFFRFTKT